MINIIDGKPTQFKESSIGGLFYRELYLYHDFRGSFIELWNDYIWNDWVEDDISISRKNTLRGFHLDVVSTKLLTPFFGDIFIAFIDIEYNSQSFYCTDGQRYQFLVRPNIGIAHCVLSDIGMLHYKQNNKYNIKNQKTIKWDDYRLDIHWPISNPIISDRDANC